MGPGSETYIYVLYMQKTCLSAAIASSRWVESTVSIRNIWNIAKISEIYSCQGGKTWFLLVLHPTTALRRPPLPTANNFQFRPATPEIPETSGNLWQPLATPGNPHPTPLAAHTIMTTYTGSSTTSEKLIKPSLGRLFGAVAEFQQEIQQIRNQEREGNDKTCYGVYTYFENKLPNFLLWISKEGQNRILCC